MLKWTIVLLVVSLPPAAQEQPSDLEIWTVLVGLTKSGAVSEEQRDHLHNHGLYGNLDSLAAYVADAEKQITELAMQQWRDRCARRTLYASKEALAADIDASRDHRANLLHDIIAGLSTVLDSVALGQLNRHVAERRIGVHEPDVGAMVRSGEMPMEKHLDRVCQLSAEANQPWVFRVNQRGRDSGKAEEEDTGGALD